MKNRYTLTILGLCVLFAQAVYPHDQFSQDMVNLALHDPHMLGKVAAILDHAFTREQLTQAVSCLDSYTQRRLAPDVSPDMTFAQYLAARAQLHVQRASKQPIHYALCEFPLLAHYGLIDRRDNTLRPLEH